MKNNFFLGILCGVALMGIVMFIADLTRPEVRKAIGLPDECVMRGYVKPEAK